MPGRPLLPRRAAELRREPPAPRRRCRRDRLSRRGWRDPPPVASRTRRRWFPGCSRCWSRPASARGTASPVSCPTCPRRSPPCSRPRRSAPSGRPPRRISASTASSIASARSSRRCSSPPMAIATPARSSTSPTSCKRRCRACRRSPARSSFPSSVPPTPWPKRSPAPKRSRRRWRRSHRSRSLSAASRSARRCSFSFLPAPPACRSASSIPSAVRCSSIMKEHQLHSAIQPGDRVFYFTTLGWMMWNWLATALASGATLMLFDGSPFHPGPEALFAYAADERFTFFGTSAKFIDAVAKAGYRPRDHHDLAALRTVSSTGSPLAPESFDFVYDAIKPDIHLASISGGTDIVSCFVLGVPTLPVWRGEIQGPGPRHGRRCVHGRWRAAAVRQGRTRLQEAVPLDAHRLLERSRRREIPRGLLRHVPQHLVPRRLRRMDGPRRHHHPRPLRRDAEPRRRAHRHGRDIPAGRAGPRGSGGPVHRSGLAGRRPRRPVRAAAAGRRSGRGAGEAHPAPRSAPAPAPATSRRRSSPSPISRAPNPARSSSWPCARWSTAARSRTARRWRTPRRWSSSATLPPSAPSRRAPASSGR